MSNASAEIVNSLLPLVGVAIGAAATVIVQRSSTSAQREQLGRQLAAQRRDEIKTAINDYFEHAQRLQRQLDAREAGESPSDLKDLMERVWLAVKRVQILASDDLSDKLIAHAQGLHQVVRDGGQFPDWWAHCSALQIDLLSSARRELSSG